ncbi:MAG: phosphate signaling complex protein PhoU [Deltaproteobacteria bacterium]|nr:phosphate signaling complex protein PhoU [Deltaproteobacteria bacterium]
MPEHTDKVFEKDLHALKELILKMGSLVETMIARSIQALEKRDLNLARDIIQEDKKVDQLEMNIDDLCLRILALHQPAAIDLRFVAVGMKISTDLERMGDLAVNICRQVIDLNQEGLQGMPGGVHFDLSELAKKSQNMVHQALDAFVAKDAVKAKNICESDDEVDKLDYQNFESLIKATQANAQDARRNMRIIIISRQLERIADHATNVAEEVLFLVKGQDIRHGG